jgi:hypothetical protein
MSETVCTNQGMQGKAWLIAVDASATTELLLLKKHPGVLPLLSPTVLLLRQCPC